MMPGDQAMMDQPTAPPPTSPPADTPDNAPPDLSKGYCIELKVKADGTFSVGIEPLAEEEQEDQGQGVEPEQEQSVDNIRDALKAVLQLYNANPIGESDEQHFQGGFGGPKPEAPNPVKEQGYWVHTTITIDDGPDGSYELRGRFGPGQFNPLSPSHQLGYALVKHAETLGQKMGDVLNTTDEVVATVANQNEEAQVLHLYEWLGRWREHMPLLAVKQLQDLLGPVDLASVGLEPPAPETIAENWVRCDTCKYWHLITDHASVIPGECRIHPPVTTLTFSGTPVRTWPLCQPDDWCGQWVTA